MRRAPHDGQKPRRLQLKATSLSCPQSALTRYIGDGDLPISNNWVENQIRPIAIRRNNWMFAGSLRAGKRDAAVMSLVHSARINGHDPCAYHRDILERLPSHPRRVASTSCCRIAGSLAPELSDSSARRQDEFIGRIPWTIATADIDALGASQAARTLALSSALRWRRGADLECIGIHQSNR